MAEFAMMSQIAMHKQSKVVAEAKAKAVPKVQVAVIHSKRNLSISVKRVSSL